MKKPGQYQKAKKLVDGGLSIKEASEKTGITTSTYYYHNAKESGDKEEKASRRKERRPVDTGKMQVREIVSLNNFGNKTVIVVTEDRDVVTSLLTALTGL